MSIIGNFFSFFLRVAVFEKVAFINACYVSDSYAAAMRWHA